MSSFILIHSSLNRQRIEWNLLLFAPWIRSSGQLRFWINFWNYEPIYTFWYVSKLNFLFIWRVQTHDVSEANPKLIVDVKTWCLAWSGLVWPGLVWPGLAWSGLVWPGLVWSGLLWSGLAWSGLVCSGLFWSALIWSALSHTSLL
jgi:hypothetical protein